MRITNNMRLPDDDIEAKKVLMSMDKEDVIDRHIYKINGYNISLWFSTLSLVAGILIGYLIWGV